MTIPEIIFTFFFFAVFGWIFELFLEIFGRRKILNRGFFKGPYIPIYAFGAFLEHYGCSPLKEHPLFVFIAGALMCSVMEYIAGIILEKIFHKRYWDYRLYPFSRWCTYQGRISLASATSFGVFALALVYYLWDVPIYIINLFAFPVRLIISGVFLTVFVIDGYFSIKKYLRNKKELYPDRIAGNDEGLI
ncbi:MAG: putative ABC transporter permease [Spirochaetaceae bacterium]|jgi:uncharacterized membrane protein|nr:putative ABC transporter permease [Spirochaetaceae bacterium]